MKSELVLWLRGVLDEHERAEREADYLAGSERGQFRLADVDAKRRILDEIVPAVEGYEWDAVADRSTTEQLVRLLASAYAHLPGYREEWRPDAVRIEPGGGPVG